ncbi:879_t:CDS:2, partial [Gigaspora rosea]
ASLGSSFNDFIRDFYLCRNNLFPDGFDIQWQKLVTVYPKAANYLNSELYSSKEKWAKTYTNKFFMAGISSTSRVEGENAIIKNVLQDRPSLCELAAILNLRLSDEVRYINHNKWYHANTSTQLKGASAKCFPEIDRILKEHLTEEMLSQQRHEIIQSLYYYTIIENKKLSNNSYTEESYDTQQIHLISLLEDLPSNEIVKTYKIQRHSLLCPALFPMCQIARIHSNDVFGPEVRRAVQKRHDYGETFNLTRKAVQSAVEVGGESLCRLKRSLND